MLALFFLQSMATVVWSLEFPLQVLSGDTGLPGHQRERGVVNHALRFLWDCVRWCYLPIKEATENVYSRRNVFAFQPEQWVGSSESHEDWVRPTVARFIPRLWEFEHLGFSGKGASVKRQVTPTWGLALWAKSLLETHCEEGNVLWVKPLSDLSKEHGIENCMLGCLDVAEGWLWSIRALVTWKCLSPKGIGHFNRETTSIVKTLFFQLLHLIGMSITVVEVKLDFASATETGMGSANFRYWRNSRVVMAACTRSALTSETEQQLSNGRGRDLSPQDVAIS